MFVLGVTGGIGSGKSAATDIFSSLGIKIVDADVLSRVPVQKGEAGLFEIEKRYGSEILLATGCLLYTSPSPRDLQGSRMPSSA